MIENRYISDVRDNTFEEMVLSSDLPVLMDFWAPWCGPCHAIAPTIEELSREHKDKVKFVKINIDEAPKTALSFDVMSIPTIILFNHGKSINRQIGAQAKSIFNEMIEEETTAERSNLHVNEPDRLPFSSRQFARVNKSRACLDIPAPGAKLARPR